MDKDLILEEAAIVIEDAIALCETLRSHEEIEDELRRALELLNSGLGYSEEE